MYFRRLAILAAAGALLSVGSVGCKKSKPDDGGTAEGGGESADESTVAKDPKRPDGPTGTIKGTVSLSGEPPEMPVLQRGSDGFCAKTEMKAETVVVGEGGALTNVLVRIAPGQVDGWVPDAPVEVNQKDCMYRPRVQGGVRGQMMHVKNSDGTMHNVNARRLPWGERRDRETLFNRGQPAGSPVLKGALHESDIYKLKCDSHGWMAGYVVVGDTPYHDASGADGSFTIENAPVGEYELQAWHEYYGIKTAKVTVEDGKTAELSFAYDAEADRPDSAGGAP